MGQHNQRSNWLVLTGAISNYPTKMMPTTPHKTRFVRAFESLLFLAVIILICQIGVLGGEPLRGLVSNDLNNSLAAKLRPMWDVEQSQLEVLQKTTDRAEELVAIYCLGQVHSRDAIPLLIKKLATDGQTNILVNNMLPWGKYPALSALVEIGKPAANALEQYLVDGPESDLHKQLAWDAFQEIEGKEIALFRIERRIAKGLTDVQKARLLSLK